ncbi:MAG TPA: response regulator transcription factor [Chloroflexota bacterium]|jgi:DNA-binding response OmpR family regulator
MAESLLLVDDEPELLALLRRGFEQHDYRVRTAADGPSALAQAAAQPPDLIVLDLMLPEMSGLEVCRALRGDERLRGVPLIILTARHETPVKVMGLDLGADDYVTKPFEFGELLARVRARLRARRRADDVVQLGGLRLMRARYELGFDGQTAPLTRREFDLLDLFLQHPNQVLLRGQLADQVWGHQTDLESNVLDVYVRRLRRKLEDLGFRGRIRTVRGDGYVLEPPPL